MNLLFLFSRTSCLCFLFRCDGRFAGQSSEGLLEPPRSHRPQHPGRRPDHGEAPGLWPASWGDADGATENYSSLNKTSVCEMWRVLGQRLVFFNVAWNHKRASEAGGDKSALPVNSVLYEGGVCHTEFSQNDFIWTNHRSEPLPVSESRRWAKPKVSRWCRYEASCWDLRSVLNLTEAGGGGAALLFLCKQQENPDSFSGRCEVVKQHLQSKLCWWRTS